MKQRSGAIVNITFNAGIKIKDFDYCLIEHITYSDSIVGGELFDFCKKHKILCGIAHTDLFEYCDMYGYDYEDFFRKMAENKKKQVESKEIFV